MFTLSLRDQAYLEVRLHYLLPHRGPSDTCLSLRVLEPKAGSVSPPPPSPILSFLFPSSLPQPLSARPLLLPLLLAAASLSFCPFPQPSPPAQQLVQDTEFCAFHRGTLRVRENSCPVRGMEKSLVFTSQRLVFPTFPSQLLRNKGPLARVLGRAQQGDSPATLY